MVRSRNVCCFLRLDYYLRFINLSFTAINFLFCFRYLITASFHCKFFRSGTFGSMVEYGYEFKVRLAAKMCIGLPFGVLLEVK